MTATTVDFEARVTRRMHLDDTDGGALAGGLGPPTQQSAGTGGAEEPDGGT